MKSPSRPIEFFWQQANPATTMKGVCTVGVLPSEISTTALNTAADWIILLIPITALSSLQLNIRRKVGLLAIFAIGLV